MTVNQHCVSAAYQSSLITSGKHKTVPENKGSTDAALKEQKQLAGLFFYSMYHHVFINSCEY